MEKEIQAILQLAEKHGLLLSDEMKFNEMGIDFKVVFARAEDGKHWVLRIPRREGLGDQIANEKRILALAGKHLSVQVPDWQIATESLVAYPLLKNKPALTFDSETYEVTWYMDQASPCYVPSLAQALVELHATSESEVAAAGLKILKPKDLRSEIAGRLALIKSELGISVALETRYQSWLDDDRLWPDFTRFVHGDLYAGHVLTTSEGEVSGIIDWSTAQISDPAIDFSGHVTVFGEESLRELIAAYEMRGGKVWDKLFEQAVERAAASPLAYGFFAVETGDEKHLAGAKAQLGS